MDFFELFAGCASASQARIAAGLKVASAVDILYQTYGRAWGFSNPTHQADAAYPIVFAFKPKILHLGVQCTNCCILGAQGPRPESESCLDFTAECAAHQQLVGLGASIENPWKSDIWTHPTLRKYMDVGPQGSP